MEAVHTQVTGLGRERLTEVRLSAVLLSTVAYTEAKGWAELKI